MVKVSDEEVRNLILFNQVSGMFASDCIESDGELVFVVSDPKIEKIERMKINLLKRFFKKNIRIVRSSKNVEEFINSFFNRNIETRLINGKVLIFPKNSFERKLIIGRKGKNINLLKLLINRYFNVSLEVK
jgi:transcription antitermination factor NusA-like protein